jgi:tetratricopeptide (TPR) repeat protein
LKNSRAITFDSPGSMRSIERLQSNIQSTNTLIDIHNLDIITYLVEPNFVNTADRHIGRVYSLTDTSEQSNNQSTWKSWTIEKALSILTTESFKDTAMSTLNNHGLDNILKTMQCDFDSNSIEPKSEELKYKPSKYSLMSNWPLIEKKPSTSTENSYTVTSIIGSIVNYEMNKINTNQTRAYHANKDDEFHSNYVINNNDLLKNEELNLSSNNLNVDYFLNKLIDINLNNLNDQLIKSQLKELKSSFSIETKLNERKKIVSDTLTISKIKEIMNRLLDVSNESIEKYFQNLNPWTLGNKSSNIKITNVLSDRPKIFTGRSKELEKINESLKSCQYVYIYGRSGTGKTTLASKYTYLLHENLLNEKQDHIIRWIDANNLKQCFMNLAEELNIDYKVKPEELFRIIKVTLNKLNRNTLFVIDNLIYDLNENSKNDFDYLLNNFESNVKFLITTKNQQIPKELSHERYKAIELKVFDQNVCINFIDEKLNIVHKNILKKEEWTKLLQDYRYLQLPIYLNKLISRINRKQRESFENIKKYLQNEKKEKFGTLKKENPYAYKILKYLSFLNRKTISYNFIGYLMINKELNDDKKQTEEESIDESINYLIENSEISINDDGLFYKIHETTQADIMSTMSEDIQKENLEKIIRALNDTISDDLLEKNKIRIDKELYEYKEHSENVFMFYLDKIENTNKNKIELLLKCAYINNKVLINNDIALEYYSKSLEIRKETLPPNHPDIATSYNNIGSIFSNKGDNDKALEYFSKSLEIYKETLPANHPDIATSYNNIGSIYKNKGDNDKALEYYSKSLEIRKETLPPNHPNIATSYNNIGLIYENKGENDKAFEYYSKSLEIYEETLPPYHPDIAGSYNNIGLIYSKKGDNDKALEYYSKSLEIDKETLPPNHPNIATYYNNIGLIYSNKGDNDKALEYYSKSLEIYKETLPPNHPNIAGSCNNIGLIYFNKGDNDKALEYHSKSLEIRKETLPPNHPDIATSYNNIGLIYYNKGDNDKALEYHSKSLEIYKETLPANHPDIATSYNNIGSIYKNKGDNDKALEYYSKSLEIRKETLPPNHPDIATSYNNIGLIYYNKGDNDKALEYHSKSLEIYKETLPPNHPDIATSYNNIGLIYYNKGDNDKALEYHSKSLEIYKETLPPNHPNIATSYNNIGGIYSKKGDNDKALEYYSKSVEILKETLPPNHPNIATSYNNIGGIYSNKGDNDKALEYFSKSLEIYKETLPPNHQNIALSYNNIGGIYYNKGDNDKALEYFSKSLEIYKETLPPNHQNIAMSYNNKGFIYYKTGDIVNVLLLLFDYLKSLGIVRVSD